MKLAKLGNALVNAERVLCVQPSGIEGHEDSITVTYDTGEIVSIPDVHPSQSISRYLDASISASDIGTM